MGIHYTAEARIDFLKGLEYYEKQQEGLAIDFYKEFIAAEEAVRDTPEFWHLVGKSYRRKHLKRYPYSLVYTIKPDHILIVAVAHSSRMPNYWLEE